MKIEKQEEVIDAIMKPLKTAGQLSDVLFNDYSVSPDDWTAFSRLREKLFACRDLLIGENTLSFLIAFHCKCDSEEEKFQVQKTINFYYQTTIIDNLESLEKISKTWGFDDYRCIDFQKEVKETANALLEYFSKKLSDMNLFISNM